MGLFFWQTGGYLHNLNWSLASKFENAWARQLESQVYYFRAFANGKFQRIIFKMTALFRG